MRSCRRIFIDQLLYKCQNTLEGNILDIGGEKYSTKGLHKPFIIKELRVVNFLILIKKANPIF